ncbi:hypothetical protein BD779DRAFT_1679465 [Infundibulicybe gibba]|nr:hypothetical protein BD779DRAFT_1679465 [Infundibulicybe gibba]
MLVSAPHAKSEPRHAPAPRLAWPNAIRKPRSSKHMLVTAPNGKPKPQHAPTPRLGLAQRIDESGPISTERAEQQPTHAVSAPYAGGCTILLAARAALSPDPQVCVEFSTSKPDPAQVVPPFIPGREYDAPAPYVPVRSPANADHVQPPPCLCHPPGGYPGVPRPQVDAYVSATRGLDAELPAHADARYQITGRTYPTSLAQQRSPWLLFPYSGAPACGHHHHQPGGTNVHVTTNGDVGVVQVTVQTQPR